MDNKLTPGEIVVMAAGVVGLIAAFLPFYKNGESINTFDEGLFPVATLIALFVVVAAVLVALVKFANMNLTAGVLGIGFIQLLLALGFFAALMAVAFLLSEKGNLDFGFGYFLLLIAGAGSLVGSVLVRNERAV